MVSHTTGIQKIVYDLKAKPTIIKPTYHCWQITLRAVHQPRSKSKTMICKQHHITC